MTQMKEENKTPEKELNKMEISNLSDAEFKTLVIRMLKEQHKKTQAEMKVTVSEIKKTLQGTNSGKDEAKNQINDLEHKGGKAFKHNSKKKKKNSEKQG